MTNVLARLESARESLALDIQMTEEGIESRKRQLESESGRLVDLRDELRQLDEILAAARDSLTAKA